MLHDIQEEILSLSVDNRNMAFLPLNINDNTKNTRDVATCTTRRHRVGDFEFKCCNVLCKFF